MDSNKLKIENSMTELGEIGQNGHFGVKMAIFERKKSQNGGTRFFSKLSLGNSIKRPKM